MRMDIKALSLTVAIVWGGSILLIGLANLIWTSYGVAFLEVAASIYPGYRGSSLVWAGNRGDPLRYCRWIHWWPDHRLALQSFRTEEFCTLSLMIFFV